MLSPINPACVKYPKYKPQVFTSGSLLLVQVVQIKVIQIHPATWLSGYQKITAIIYR
jgi:hypothetical protein